MKHYLLSCCHSKNYPMDCKPPAGKLVSHCIYCSHKKSILFCGSNPFSSEHAHNTFYMWTVCIMFTLCFTSYIFFSDQDVVTLNQSLRILANLIGAGAVNSRGILDEMINGLLGFTTALIRLKTPDGNDLMAKVSHWRSHSRMQFH